MERTNVMEVDGEPHPCAHMPSFSGVLQTLHAQFRPQHVDYIVRTLTPGELTVIADLADALILARIKRMPDSRLRRFDNLIPRDEHHQAFRILQMQWLRDEQYLLSTRLGRWPTPKELFVDFMSHRNGLRFRAYFAMKYRWKMRRLSDDVDSVVHTT